MVINPGPVRDGAAHVADFPVCPPFAEPMIMMSDDTRTKLTTSGIFEPPNRDKFLAAKQQ